LRAGIRLCRFVDLPDGQSRGFHRSRIGGRDRREATGEGNSEPDNSSDDWVFVVRRGVVVVA